MRRKITVKVSSLLPLSRGGRSFFFFFSFSSPISNSLHRHYHHLVRRNTTRLLCFRNLCSSIRDEVPSVPASSFCSPRWFSSSSYKFSNPGATLSSCNDEADEIEPIDSWEEEDEADPQIGDGGDGGGIVLQDCSWGERALSIAREVILKFGDGFELFAFKTSPKGYIYVRLDKLSNEYGCPSIEEIESFSREYKAKVDEAGATGDIPDDLGLEVSSPGAERLLKVPDDLDRFRDMIMRVTYVESSDTNSPLKDGVFLLESVETESGLCIWKLADVKENRDPSAKGRSLSRKQKDWRLKLPYDMFKKVTLYLDY